MSVSVFTLRILSNLLILSSNSKGINSDNDLIDPIPQCKSRYPSVGEISISFLKIAIALIFLNYLMYIIEILFESHLCLSLRDYLAFQSQLDYV